MSLVPAMTFQGGRAWAGPSLGGICSVAWDQPPPRAVLGPPTAESFGEAF